MLRVYFLQQRFALSDPGVEDALYESPAVCSTAAAVSDVRMLPDLLHGEARKVWGDAVGVRVRPRRFIKPRLERRT